ALVSAVVIMWVVRSDETLQDAAAAAGDRKRARAARAMARAVPRVSLRRWATWSLHETGSVEGLLFWKNGMYALRSAGGLMLMRFVALMAILVGGAITMASTYSRGAAAGFCVLALGLSAFVVILGPQVVRTDLRADLRHLVMLRTWPVRPA